MDKLLEIRKIGVVARVADLLMVPLMYLLSGTLREKPQKTHPWNVQSLPPGAASELIVQEMAHCKGIAKQFARRHKFDFLFHIPIIGGWRNYVVLEPEYDCVWHVGWKTSDVGAQISILPLAGPVRMLVGAGDVSFFGLNERGAQIPIREIGNGRIGDKGPYSGIQLC